MLRRVLLAGDSISMGYGPYVRQMLEGRFTVENLPDNGKTSRNMLNHLDEWFIQPGYDLIHLNCGLHDLARGRDTGETRISLAEYKDNVIEIVQRMKNETQSRLVWASITPVVYDLHHKNKSFDRHESDVEEYNRATTDIMEKRNVPNNDLHAVAVGKLDEILHEDGVHFTPEGYQLLAGAVAKFIGERIEP